MSRSNPNDGYDRRAKRSLLALWLGASLFLGLLLYSWTKDDFSNKQPKNWVAIPKNIFVDQLLLSATDLQLEVSASLINITLSKDMKSTVAQPDTVVKTTADRKNIYSNILKQKIKKISKPSAQADNFEIKPLPK